ncbi:MAG: ribonuclease P protein component 1 [Candidatus Odinarchaeota archaeon]|nr:ribonuclease P protein subunit [Candidatus Thorarchaeota archaeon]
MKITPENIVRHELTGLPMHIVKSTDPNLVSKKGIILRETKEMIHFGTDSSALSVPKSNCVFDVTLPDGTQVRIKGDVLRGRPEDRMKKRLNRSW